MAEELKIIEKKKISVDGSGIFYEVELSNGTFWKCDYLGKNWIQIYKEKKDEELSDDYLLNKFKNK